MTQGTAHPGIGQRFARQRVACTGYHLSWLRNGAWHSWTDSHEDVLRSGFRSSRLAPPPAAGSASAPTAGPLGAALESVLRDLAGRDLFGGPGHALSPDRLAVCFSSSKHHFLNQLVGAATYGPGDGCDAAALEIARALGARGAVLAPVAACAGGAHTVALAAQWIEDGYADAVVCGAVEVAQHPLLLAAYGQLGALSKSGVMRPFDARRDGFVPSGGAAMLVLESEAMAIRRGATILGWVDGWSLQGDATAMTTMTPSGETIARAVETAMARAALTKVDYVNAHGTATRQNDDVESRGLMSSTVCRAPVSSTKSLTGHWLGAAGALEAIICLMAMREGYAPGTLGLELPDTGCDLDYIFPAGRDVDIDSCLSLNYGFGGHLAALVLRAGRTRRFGGG